MLKRVVALDIPMCVPVEFGTCDDEVYSLQSWIDGEDLETVLPLLSAFDGIAYKSGNSSSSDMMIVDAGEAEGIYMASFPIAGEHFTNNFADDVAIDAPYQRLCYMKNCDELLSGLMFTCLDGYPHITAMATKREYQGRGYGKKLINHFVNYVSQLGFHDIELYAWSEKTKPICASTQAFYKSVGFVVTQEHMGLWEQDMITIKMKKSW